MLEYITGQNLRQFIAENGVVSPAMVVHWALEICSILQYLHEQNPPIMHRDLTPDNLIRTNEGQIVLIDFGAANQFLGAATGTIIGKQAYIPPEQLRGKTVLQSDIYALGCTINYLLTGKDPLPLSQSHPSQNMQNIPAELDEIVARCTCFEPEDRYQTVKQIENVLNDLVPRLKDDIAEIQSDKVESIAKSHD